MKAIKTLTRHNLQNTFWGKRIIAATERGNFTSKDEDLARDWVTCACGKSTVDIPRHTEETDGHYYAEPKDSKLRSLGDDFSLEVSQQDMDEAARVLVAIEKRALIVAKSIKQELNNETI